MTAIPTGKQLKNPYLIGAGSAVLALIVIFAAGSLGATHSEIGQTLLAILVSFIGYLLHNKQHQIQVIVNGRTTQLLERVDQLEQALSKNGHSIPPALPPPPEVI